MHKLQQKSLAKMQVFLLRFTKNGCEVDAKIFFCVWAMTLKLFREVSNGLKQCFKLLQHTHMSCRNRHTLSLAQVASLLLNSCKTEALKGFEISSWFLTQNGGHVDAKIFFCVWAMTLKLFREASRGLKQCFKLLQHTLMSCRTRYTLALAQVA